MMTTFQINNFNPTTAKVYPNNDYAVQQTGLSQGFHVLRTREFLNRAGRASIYNTAVQTFYYDTQAPQGQIVFPGQWRHPRRPETVRRGGPHGQQRHLRGV